MIHRVSVPWQVLLLAHCATFDLCRDGFVPLQVAHTSQSRETFQEEQLFSSEAQSVASQTQSKVSSQTQPNRAKAQSNFSRAQSNPSWAQA